MLPFNMLFPRSRVIKRDRFWKDDGALQRACCHLGEVSEAYLVDPRSSEFPHVESFLRRLFCQRVLGTQLLIDVIVIV